MPQRSSTPNTTFSHFFGIQSTPDDDWFNPRLHVDTQLFVDPFLIFEETDEPWSSVEDRLVDFFDTALKLVASAGGDPAHPDLAVAKKMFSFPEPPEFCLGYAKSTIFGSGAARGLGAAMIDSAQQAIAAGITSIETPGDLLVFGDNFGADRISDMVCNIVKDVFLEYTHDVLDRHGLATENLLLDHVAFDSNKQKWRRLKPELAANPCWSSPQTSVLLVPSRFLSTLPAAEDRVFWDWVYTSFNSQLRQELGVAINSKLSKTDIIDMARRRSRLRRQFGREYAKQIREAGGPRRYDLDVDRDLLITPLDSALAFSTDQLVARIADSADMCAFVAQLCEAYRKYIERERWPSLFWKGGAKRHEPEVQPTFSLFVELACQAHDVDITQESQKGQGKVDYKFAIGRRRRALVEMKFAGSNSYWHNLDNQLPTYLQAEGIDCGTVLVLQHADDECTDDFMDESRRRAKAGGDAKGKQCELVFVDVRQLPPASKMKSTV